MYPIVYIPSEDFSRFQGALSLADQTLKLDAGRGDICAATTKNARKLKQLAEEGVLLAYGKINLMQRIVSLEELRCEVDDTWNRLLQCFANEAKYRDLVTELRQIFRQHYILKYVSSTAEAGRESIRAFCGSKPDDLRVDCVRTRKSPGWAQIISGMDEERPLLVSWQDALRRHALARNPGPPPPQPSTPSTDMAKAVAGLFCEDGWHAVWDAGFRGELFELIAENTVGRRRHPYFNRYTDYLMVGNFKALANSFYVDKLYL
ncbi:hypothetical protein CcaCcLH18_10720 [Colletotrichum camelliae]|nr:hypothetical protein CcaCcLH18_10720 [Colletotrichum camelliae]